MAVLLGWILASMMVGCGGKSFEYHSGNEIPEGPGVLSGEDGEFTVYDSKKAAKDKEASAESKSGPQAAEVPAGAGAAAAAAGQTDEAREYQEVQQWQQWREYKKWQERQQPAN